MGILRNLTYFLNFNTYQMKKQCTYAQLGVYLRDIEKQVTESPAFELFNHEKINRFYTLNKERIGIYNETHHKIFTENVNIAHLPDGDIYNTIDVNGIKEWDFKSPDHKTAFEEATAVFINLSFTIQL